MTKMLIVSCDKNGNPTKKKYLEDFKKKELEDYDDTMEYMYTRSSRNTNEIIHYYKPKPIATEPIKKQNFEPDNTTKCFIILFILFLFLITVISSYLMNTNTNTNNNGN
jgi:hypothetical protein